MIQLFLRVKHWQLFVLTFGVLLVAEIVWIVDIFDGLYQSMEYEIYMEELVSNMTGLFLVAGFSMLIIYGWIWSIGVGMQRYIPDDLKMNTSFFTFAIIFPILFFVFYMWFIRQLIITEFDINPFVFLLFVPFILFVAFCSFYTYWFAGKAIKTAELQRKVRFSDFMAEFFLFWFYPVGVWIIQPNIKKIMEK